MEGHKSARHLDPRIPARMHATQLRQSAQRPSGLDFALIARVTPCETGRYQRKWQYPHGLMLPSFRSTQLSQTF